MRSQSFYDNYEKTFLEKVEVRGPDECWNFKMHPASKRRYGSVTFHGTPIGAHVMAYRLFKGSENGLYVMHSCDNPRCVNPAHLHLGTNADNQQDCVKKGRKPNVKGSRNPMFDCTGQLHPNAKLTDKAVQKLRQLYRTGWTQVRLADRFHIDQTTVSKIIRGVTYPHA